MPNISLESLVKKIREKRGHRGIREVALEIGISAATLSRVERGHLPDLETFKKICAWVDVDPAEILGLQRPESARPAVRVHFKKDSTLSAPTAKALAELILVAQARMRKEEGLEG